MAEEDGESLRLGRAWAVLHPPTKRGLNSFPLEVSFADLPCRAAVDETGVRHLLIPCIDELPELDSRPAILDAVIRALSFTNTKAAVYLDISCSDKELFPEFDDVISDILERIVDSMRPASDAAEALARLRKLFRSRFMRGLGPEAKIGLFAELSVLRVLLTAGAISVKDWRGPLREPHDFEAPKQCIEVKALSETGDGFFVHGWQQLDTHDGKPLTLALLMVVPDPDGLNIADLVAEIEKLGDSQPALESRLVAAGWDGVREDEDRFTLGPSLIVPVSDVIPRLTPAMLLSGVAPEGLSDLRYRVSLDSVLPFAVSSSIEALAEFGAE